MKTYKCTVCGEVFTVEDGQEPVCPVCKVKGDKLELVEEKKTNKYAGTQTEKNLETAFAGESQARNKYTYFASKAKKEGFEQIAALFELTANNEKEHAKLWFKELNGIGTTAENLAAAAAEGMKDVIVDENTTIATDAVVETPAQEAAKEEAPKA